MLVRRQKKKTWTDYFVYVSCGIAKHLNNHIRVKAHAGQREHPCFYSWLLLNFGEISESKIQADASIPICLLSLLCHTQSFKGLYIICY